MSQLPWHERAVWLYTTEPSPHLNYVTAVSEINPVKPAPPCQTTVLPHIPSEAHSFLPHKSLSGTVILLLKSKTSTPNGQLSSVCGPWLYPSHHDVYTTILHESKRYCRVKVGETWGRLRIARGQSSLRLPFARMKKGRRRNWQPRVILTLHLRRWKSSGLTCPGLAGCLWVQYTEVKRITKEKRLDVVKEKMEESWANNHRD